MSVLSGNKWNCKTKKFSTLSGLFSTTRTNQMWLRVSGFFAASESKSGPPAPSQKNPGRTWQKSQRCKLKATQREEKHTHRAQWWGRRESWPPLWSHWWARRCCWEERQGWAISGTENVSPPERSRPATHRREGRHREVTCVQTT